MSYRLDPVEPVGDEVRRIAVEQLTEAVDRLRGEDVPLPEDIHHARTSLKKVRSLLRLVRRDVGAPTWRATAPRYRAAGQALSARRDADVVIDTFAALAGRLVGVVDVGTVARISAGLTSDAAAARSTGTAGLSPAAVADDLAAARAEVDGWKVGPGFSALAPGLGRQYAEGRGAQRRLGSHPSDEDRHDLRKRTKDLWYHLLLLRSAWPPVTKVLAEQAHDLSDLLGDDHDLAVLRERIAAIDGGDHGALYAALDAERADLLARATDLAARLYADRPDAWVDRLARWWKAAASSASTPPTTD